MFYSLIKKPGKRIGYIKRDNAITYLFKIFFMIVIVLGLPGSGKSFFASRFAGLIHANYVNSDVIRKSLFPARSYSEKEKLSVYHKMLELMQQALRQNKSLVLDATFHKNDIRKLFTDEARNKGGIVFIEVTAPEDIIKERLKRKRADSEADFDVYKLIKQQWEPLREHRLILTSADNNIEDMLHKAADYLKLKDDKRAYY